MTEPVQALLDKKQINYRISGQDLLISCLNPDHADKNPSFRVDRITGMANCFSCGFKTNIFKFFGLSGNHQSIKIAKLKEKLSDLNINFNGAEFPHDQIPFTKPFKGISVKTLTQFEAFYTLTDDKFIDRIFFPIRDIRGKTQVFIGRHLLSQGNPRYLIEPRKREVPLFPAKLEEPGSSLIIVEGIFDFLNLYDKGLKNVACAFGTNTLGTSTELKLLSYKAQGVVKIYLMFDGDEAGQEAMNKLQPTIEELGFMVEQIELEEGTDPGDMPQDQVNQIKEYIRDKDSSYN